MFTPFLHLSPPALQVWLKQLNTQGSDKVMMDALISFKCITSFIQYVATLVSRETVWKMFTVFIDLLDLMVLIKKIIVRIV